MINKIVNPKVHNRLLYRKGIKFNLFKLWLVCLLTLIVGISIGRQKKTQEYQLTYQVKSDV